MAGTVALTEEAVRAYLDGEIKRLQEITNSVASYGLRRNAYERIGALQGVRINLLGEMFPPHRGRRED